MIVKNVEINENGQKTYIFGEDVLFQMCAEAILAADGAIDNEAPDLALRKLMEMANNVRAWGC